MVEHSQIQSIKTGGVWATTNNNLEMKQHTNYKIFEYLLEQGFIKLENVSYWNGLYIFAVLVYAILFPSLMLVIPQHDVIKYPEYWYELMIIYTLVFPAYLTLTTIQQWNIFFKISEMLSLRTAKKLFLSATLGFLIPYCICYIAWTICLGYNHPIPFVGLCGYPMWIIFCATIWFEFPSNLRNDIEFRKRIQAYMLLNLWQVIINLQYCGLSTIFAILPPQMQWIMAVIMPIFRWCISRVWKKLLGNSAGDDNKMAAIQMNGAIGIGYSLFVAITLTSCSTLTQYCILVVEFLLNMILCDKIIRFHRKVGPDNPNNSSLKDEIENGIQNLVLNELIEVLVPLAYFITLLIAYYGPNASIIGTVRNTYWDYEEVDDVGKHVVVGMKMFFIDLTSVVFSGFLLYRCCKINLIQEYCKIIKQCWTLIAITLGGYVMEVMEKTLYILLNY